MYPWSSRLGRHFEGGTEPRREVIGCDFWLHPDKRGRCTVSYRPKGRQTLVLAMLLDSPSRSKRMLPRAWRRRGSIWPRG